MKSVYFLLFPGFEILDFTGPLEVFFEAKKHGLDLEIHYCASTPELACEQGLSLSRLEPFPDFRSDDLVYVPGLTLEVTPLPQDLVPVLRRAHQAGARIVSACTGAFVLGQAGLLDGRACTTHWKRIDEFKRRFPRAQVATERLFIEDGRIITGGGATCCIDLALFLMEQERGPLFSSQIARELVIYFRRDAHHPQVSVYLDYRSHQNPGVHAVQDWLIDHPSEQVDMEELAKIGGMSGRNLTRVFKISTGISPGEYRTMLRLERAMVLLRNPQLTVEAVASQCGFSDSRTLRRLWKKRFGISPRTEKELRAS